MEVLTFPKSFDENEIFVLCVVCGLILLFIYLPKRFPIRLFILLFLINPVIGRTVDTALAIHPLDIYSSFDKNTYEVFDEITYSIVYSFYGYVFYYFYDKYHKLPSWLHVGIWAVSSTIFEWISIRFDVFHYHQWHLQYSFIVYLLVFTFHIFFFKWASKQLHYTSERIQQLKKWNN